MGYNVATRAAHLARNSAALGEKSVDPSKEHQLHGTGEKIQGHISLNGGGGCHGAIVCCAPPQTLIFPENFGFVCGPRFAPPPQTLSLVPGP